MGQWPFKLDKRWIYCINPSPLPSNGALKLLWMKYWQNDWLSHTHLPPAEAANKTGASHRFTELTWRWVCDPAAMKGPCRLCWTGYTSDNRTILLPCSTPLTPPSGPRRDIPPPLNKHSRKSAHACIRSITLIHVHLTMCTHVRERHTHTHMHTLPNMPA